VQFDPKGKITWPELDRKLIAEFYTKAAMSTSDPINRFIFSWIILNHYYTAWAIIGPDPVWGKKPTERQEASNLSKLPSVISAWTNLLRLNLLKSLSIDLPLRDRRGRDVPDGKSGSFIFGQLSSLECLVVLYQLRCDFFHGERSIRGYGNIGKINFASKIAFELMKMVVADTTPK
jgi:hypothetical protein